MYSVIKTPSSCFKSQQTYQNNSSWNQSQEIFNSIRFAKENITVEDTQGVWNDFVVAIAKLNAVLHTSVKAAPNLFYIRKKKSMHSPQFLKITNCFKIIV